MVFTSYLSVCWSNQECCMMQLEHQIAVLLLPIFSGMMRFGQKPHSADIAFWTDKQRYRNFLGYVPQPNRALNFLNRDQTVRRKMHFGTKIGLMGLIQAACKSGWMLNRLVQYGLCDRNYSMHNGSILTDINTPSKRRYFENEIVDFWIQDWIISTGLECLTAHLMTDLKLSMRLISIQCVNLNWQYSLNSEPTWHRESARSAEYVIL